MLGPDLKLHCTKAKDLETAGPLHGHCIYAAFLRSARTSIDITPQKELQLVMMLRALAVISLCNRVAADPNDAMVLMHELELLDDDVGMPAQQWVEKALFASLLQVLRRNKSSFVQCGHEPACISLIILPFCELISISYCDCCDCYDLVAFGACSAERFSIWTDDPHGSACQEARY